MSTSEDSDSSPDLKKKKKKHKRKEKKHKKKKSKHKSEHSRKSRKKKHSKEEKKSKKVQLAEPAADLGAADPMPGPSIPDEILQQVSKSKSRTPMTKEEWEKSQNVIRRVCDETGRSRLIKGDGEILEEICSKERHKNINKQATLADGLYFQSKLMNK